MSRVNNRNFVTHRDPAQYDLPHGDWVCKKCAAEMLGVMRGQLAEVARDHDIDSVIAYQYEKSPGAYARTHGSFFDHRLISAAIRARQGNDLPRKTMVGARNGFGEGSRKYRMPNNRAWA